MKLFNEFNPIYVVLILGIFFSSCQKKTMDSVNVNGTMVFSSVNDFQRSTQNFEVCYITNRGNGIFVKSKNRQLKPDNYLVIRKNNGDLFIKEEYQTRGVIRPEWFGAKGDGVADDWNAFDMAIKKTAELKSTFSTGGKNYHISKPIAFSGGGTSNLIWQGNGATLDNMIRVNGQKTTIKDITVKNSPTNGFIWGRGQGGFFHNLKAIKCKEAGFVLGGKDRSQVAWSTFINLVSTGNKIGFLIDGSGEKSWVNANMFDGFYSRNNKEHGVKVLGKVNYNTFTGLHCEGNGKGKTNIPALFLEKAIDNIFIGGHLVTHNNCKTSVVVDNGTRNNFIGGRYVSGGKNQKAIQSKRGKVEMSRQVIRNPKDRKDIPKNKF